jgi:molybdopterin-guanine dinucleotide biosynthesis protein MobB
MSPPEHHAGTARPVVLGICGYSGSGKTTLIEQAVGRLRAAGLRVAVIKHDAHTLDVDKPGKDSDRLFRSGADVLVHDSRQALLRLHAADMSIDQALARLGGGYDVVLVEGHKGSPLSKVWLAGPDDPAPPAEAHNVLAVLPRDADRVGQVCELVLGLLAGTAAAGPA